MVKEEYKEIYKLKKMLEQAGIPFEFQEEFFNGCILKYPTFDKNVCSVIEHDGSYGRQSDELEICGLTTDNECKYDDVLGWLSAENVFARIERHYKENKLS